MLSLHFNNLPVSHLTMIIIMESDRNPLDKCWAVVGVLTIICINNVWYLIPDLGLLLLPPTPVGNLMIAASISRGYITQLCFCQIKKHNNRFFKIFTPFLSLGFFLGFRCVKVWVFFLFLHPLIGVYILCKFFLLKCILIEPMIVKLMSVEPTED